MRKNVLVAIDAMYIVYWSIFRTIRIWQKQHKTEAKEYLEPADENTKTNLLDSATFKSGLSISLIHTCTRINDIITEAFPKYLGLMPTVFAHQLFIIDDKTSNGFRRELYPDYKTSRVVARKQQPFNISAIREYVVGYLLDELNIWDRLGYTKVFVPGAEADDIIYTVMTEFDTQFADKLVIGSDHDLLQIPNTIQFNLQNKLVARKDRHGNLLSSQDFLIRKIITGDPGDNIPNIKPRYGVARAEKLINNKDQLKKLLTEDEEALKQFKLNASLIDMSKMPEKLNETIIIELTDLFNDLLSKQKKQVEPTISNIEETDDFTT